MKMTASVAGAAATVLLLGALASSEVFAIELMVPNKGGGGIYITSETCPSSEQLRLAYGRNTEGHTVFGCWFIKGDFVWIKWSGGQLYSYPSADFKEPPGNRPTPPSGVRNF